jgi:hypothetical protein
MCGHALYSETLGGATTMLLTMPSLADLRQCGRWHCDASMLWLSASYF